MPADGMGAKGGQVMTRTHATGNRPALPARIGDLFQREERCSDLLGDYSAVADYVASHATPKA